MLLLNPIRKQNKKNEQGGKVSCAAAPSGSGKNNDSRTSKFELVSHFSSLHEESRGGEKLMGKVLLISS
jgi:hypothetical protein